jgi:hypothetical protein
MRHEGLKTDGILFGVVAAEEKFATREKNHPNIGLRTATITTINGI